MLCYSPGICHIRNFFRPSTLQKSESGQTGREFLTSGSTKNQKVAKLDGRFEPVDPHENQKWPQWTAILNQWILKNPHMAKLDGLFF